LTWINRQVSPVWFDVFIRTELEKWTKAVKAAGITAD
jgi:hypothetical protein